jgi:glycosyltransferase involved in cell wall biosynthesis
MNDIKVLHISALPVWSMEGKGGMPSLLKTIQGHIHAGFILHLILPKYDLLSNDFIPLHIKRDQGYEVSIMECRWLPIIKKIRSLSCRGTGRSEPPYIARWILNMLTMLFLTFSFVSQAFRIRHKQNYRPDIIYAHNQYAALAGFVLRILWGVPNISRLYGTFLADLMGKPLVSLRYPTAAAGYLIPASLLICANDGTRGDEVAQKFHIPPHRFRFWQNGVDPPQFIPNASREEFISKYGPLLRLESKWAVSCSRLSYWKRIDRIIRALAICRNRGVDCQLLIAGEGPERDSLISLSRRMGIADALVWLGAVAHDDIWSLLHVADVLMITNDVTNRCNPLYEAAWAGLPVLSVYDQSTKDLLKHGDNALLSNKDDAEGLGLSLIEVCENHQVASRLSENQRKLSESFWTWEQRMQVETSDLKRLIYSCR